MPKKNSSREMLMKKFQFMQINVKELLKTVKKKISFGVDGWTAPNSCSYYRVTTQFLNEDMNLNAFALSLIPSGGKHKGVDIARLFLDCIIFYEIEHKIGGITLDNASSNKKFVEELGHLLAAENIDFDVENGYFFKNYG